MELNCLITDDEPIAQGIIADYLKQVPGMNLVGKCHDALETLTTLHKQKIDVLFLDVNMPEITGIELVRSLKNVPMVVFVSAYPSKAVEGFELDAVDYLLKPVSFDRFLKTVDKLFARKRQETSVLTSGVSPPPLNEQGKPYFFVKAGQGFEKVEFSKILYVEGYENYIKIICEHKTILSLNTMKNAESLLSPNGFVRIHRSYIINLEKIDSIQEQSFIIGGRVLSVGKSYRKTIQQMVRTLLS